MAKSDYQETQALYTVFAPASVVAPTSLLVALYTADPTDAGTGTEVSTTSTGYARKASAFADWTVSGDLATNAIAITFNESTAAWGIVTHFGILDQLGNLRYYGALGTARDVNAAGITLSFAAGALDITES